MTENQESLPCRFLNRFGLLEIASRYRAQRIKGRAAYGNPFAFRWFYRDVLFRNKTKVIRFLYCHEYYHYYLHEVLGRKGAAETACDRFALEHFRRRKP